MKAESSWEFWGRGILESQNFWGAAGASPSMWENSCAASTHSTWASLVQKCPSSPMGITWEKTNRGALAQGKWLLTVIAQSQKLHLTLSAWSLLIDSMRVYTFSFYWEHWRSESFPRPRLLKSLISQKALTFSPHILTQGKFQRTLLEFHILLSLFSLPD